MLCFWCQCLNFSLQTYSNVGNTKVFYMPIWSWKELDHVRATMYPSVDRDRALQLFSRIYGGVPRWVLEKPSFQAEMHDEDESLQAIESIGLSDVSY